MNTCGNCIWFESFVGEKIGVCRCGSTDEEVTADKKCASIKYEGKIYEDNTNNINNKIFERTSYYFIKK
ncbi:MULTISPECIES: hypothetical protein [unclassified Clostridium]|uniref:hypothetical protein n=1 Tax=unclassified Clostridium TaxID=2614128 RepID=UPI0013E8C3A9|nr:hypothetical protein [Clostridium sp. JN-9]